MNVRVDHIFQVNFTVLIKKQTYLGRVISSQVSQLFFHASQCLLTMAAIDRGSQLGCQHQSNGRLSVQSPSIDDRAKHYRLIVGQRSVSGTTGTAAYVATVEAAGSF